MSDRRTLNGLLRGRGGLYISEVAYAEVPVWQDLTSAYTDQTRG